MQDKVTMAKKQVCRECEMSATICFICGLPARKNYTELADGRILCERDAANAVLSKEEGLRICRESRQSLGRLLTAFMSFPEANVSVAMVDRVNLQELFRFPGHDYTCPNVWGYYHSETNGAALRHEISLLLGLPLEAFKATCAHEYTHAWVTENLPAERRKSINRDAVEGFCELIAFLLMDAQMEEGQKQLMKLNSYTRGQIHLFLEAEERYGLNEVIKWMKYGTDDRLSDDLAQRGFRFVGSTICYAFMQAVGMVNDHTTNCFRHRELARPR